jgi:hypothetical protein
MASIAQYSVMLASLDQQIEAWLLSQLLIVAYYLVLDDSHHAIFATASFIFGPAVGSCCAHVCGAD